MLFVHSMQQTCPNELNCSDQLSLKTIFLLTVKQKPNDFLVTVMTFCSYSLRPVKGFPHVKVGNAGQKNGITPLKETNVGLAQVLFDP